MLDSEYRYLIIKDLLMNRYEFVVVIDTGLSQEKRKTLIWEVEKLFWKSIKDKDDMWAMDLAISIKSNKKAYYMSYFLELDPTLIVWIKKQLSIMKWVLRFVFFKMNEKEEFLKFSDINKKYEISNEEKHKQENQNAFKNMDIEVKRKK